MGNELFTIPDSGKWAIPFVELDFWQWLVLNKPDSFNYIKVKGEYLRTLGFDGVKHRLSSEDVELMRHTVNHYGWCLAEYQDAKRKQQAQRVAAARLRLGVA